MHNFDGRYLQVIERAGRGCKISAGSICKSWKEQVEDAKFLRGVSAKYRKSRLRMRNFCREYLQGIENVGCRCKICEGSILKSKKRQDVDAIIHARQVEKHLQVQRKASCRCIGPKKSIYNSEYQSLADTLVPKRASATANIKVLQIHQTPEKQISSSFRIFQSRYTSKARKRLCNPANWSRACPTKLSRSA